MGQLPRHHLVFGKGYFAVQKVRLKAAVESEDSTAHILSAGAAEIALTWTLRSPGAEPFSYSIVPHAVESVQALLFTLNRVV